MLVSIQLFAPINGDEAELNAFFTKEATLVSIQLFAPINGDPSY
ncbi:hypothetical protein LBWT_X4190 (plasmid) [Leptolyngbya boryana IAM M-101]|nr:hypothetical protein LBWT_X4190 [Leptolyngbya boryana IAM M-101]BAS66695.1 hypothetical protein LBDG_X4190 [Leptolyngbya boryana dg5]